MKHTEETKRRISESLKGRRLDHLKKIGFKKGYVPWNKGKKNPLREGEVGHFTGKTHTLETRNKLRKKRLGKKNPNYKNGIRNYRKKAWDHYPHKCNRCEVENPKVLRVHHKDRNRENNDLDNLEILCLNCHALEHDFNPVKNLGIYARKGHKKDYVARVKRK